MRKERPNFAEVEPKAKIAIVCQGQGTQHVGMGKELYDQFDAAKRIWLQAEEFFKFPLRAFAFEGPESQLQKTPNAQPAILTDSIAQWVVAKERGILVEAASADFVAGHSLGEFTACYISGALTFEDTVRVVKKRADLMEKAIANKGGEMWVVIGLDEQTVEEVCRITGAEIANYNSPEQFTLSGTRETLVVTADLLKSAGAKRVEKLPVAGAFHTSFMDEVVLEFGEFLQKVSFADVQIPLITNFDGAPKLAGSLIKQAILAQTNNPNLWLRCIQHMLNSKVRNFFEIGPKRNVLGRMIERTNLGFGYSIATFNLADLLRT